ncbi:hypothetical protein Glove_81g80 [Diversispora epigaea]|uniref:Uncharacterized protein n=1 Tax=Diversispora epigaea TaxID=1348612 RepID=A0A397JBJ0_9GLOM|nr:hypothetical protein Glove_81g80 [Diversispora epigaea]
MKITCSINRTLRFISHRTLEEAISFEAPDCFKVRGLEKNSAELTKDGRDFCQEIWYRTHIDLSRREGITSLEHLAIHLKRALVDLETDTEDEGVDHEE